MLSVQTIDSISYTDLNSGKFVLDASGVPCYVNNAGRLVRLNGGTFQVYSTNTINTDGGICDLILFSGSLYALTIANNGRIWRLDGTSWTELATPGAGGCSMLVFNNQLYVCVTTFDTLPFSIKRWNGSSWITVVSYDGNFTIGLRDSLFSLGSNLYVMDSYTGKCWLVGAGILTQVTPELWSNEGIGFRYLNDGFVKLNGKIYAGNVLTDFDNLRIGSLFSWDGVAASWTSEVPFSESYQTRRLGLLNGNIYASDRFFGDNKLWKWNGSTAFTEEINQLFGIFTPYQNGLLTPRISSPQIAALLVDGSEVSITSDFDSISILQASNNIQINATSDFEADSILQVTVLPKDDYFSRISYGVKIYPLNSTLTNYELGCIDGVIRWITDRQNLDLWKYGIVTKDSFSEVSNEIELEEGGSYSTMSSCDFECDNSNDLANLIKDLNLDLIPAKIEFYTLRDEAETLDWSGKIVDWSYDADIIKFKCTDSFRGIHKPILKRSFTKDEFGESISSDILNKPIPACFGYVSKALLFPVIKKEVYETVCISSGISYDFAPCTAYTSVGSSEAYKVYKINLKTVDKVFAANELSGKFLVEIKGGSDSKKIKSNLASSGGITEITLYGKFGTAPKLWSETGADVTYFQITSMVVTYVVSQKQLKEFSQIDNKNAIFTWDSQALEFDNVSDIGGAFNVSNINGFQLPGCSILSKPSNVNGDTFYQVYSILPFLTELAEVKSNCGTVTGTRPNPGANIDLLYLRDGLGDFDLNYTWICTSDSGQLATLRIPFKIPTNSKFLKGNFSNLLFAFNQVIEFNTVNNYRISLNVKLIDFLNRITTALETPDRILFFQTPNGHYDSSDYIIPNEYGISAGPNSGRILENLRDRLSINQSSKNLENVKDAEIYPFIIFELKIEWQSLIGSSIMTLSMTEVTLIGEKKLNLLTDDIFLKLKGDTFGSNWGGRKTANSAVENIADFVEHWIRNYDERPDVIDTAGFDLLSHASTGSRKDWFIGFQSIKETNSYNLIDDLARFGFFGVVPKNNGRRTLKTWIGKTPIATHSYENGIVEDSIERLEPSSFANLINSPRINYAYNPATDDFDLFLEITKIDEEQFPEESEFTYNGTIFSPWTVDYVDLGGGNFRIEITTLAQSNFKTGDYAFLVGSNEGYNFTKRKLTKVSNNLYTVLTNVEPLVHGPSSAGDLTVLSQSKKTWKSFAIGYNDDEYERGKTNWEYCHNSFLKYGIITTIEKEKQNCIYFPDIEGVWNLASNKNSAKLYMDEFCKWTPFRKDLFAYKLPNTLSNSALEVLDRINFNDSVYTKGVNKIGTIVKKATIPKLGRDCILIYLMLDPEI